MEFEVLHQSKKKKLIIAGCAVVLILAAVIFTVSFARYRTTQSVQIATGTINYIPYDFNVLAMYQENGSGGYDEITRMPSASNYQINKERSYCNVNGVKDSSAVLETVDGHHTIANLQVGSKCYLYFDEGGGSAVDVILANSTGGSGTPNFANTSCSNGTNNGSNCDEATVGLYEGEENGETIYYFRGDVDDNWVSFAGFYWRIIRTNSDGSIRMIYNGTSTATTGTSTQIQTSAFNSTYNASYYVGLKYSTSQHGTTTNSTIMGILNTWYTSNLASYASQLTSGTGFCSDRDMASGYSWSANPSSSIYYAAYGRLITNKTPTLDCNTASDNFTTSGTGSGNGALQYPIGLITADEVAMAGGKNANNYGYYLYTGQNYWTLSPYHFSVGSSDSWAYVFYVHSAGILGTNFVYNALGVRPVINLRADVSLSGSGTSSNPYIVQN